MKEILLNLFENINYTEDDYEIVQLVDNFDMTKIPAGKFADILKAMEKSFECINPELFPIFVESLYSSNNVRKFKIACYLLAKYANKMKYIPRLEDYELQTAKFKEFLSTLLYLCKDSDNDVAECMFTILKNNSDKYEFRQEDEGTIVFLIANRLEVITSVLKEHDNEIDTQTARLVLILLDLVSRFSNDRVFRAVKECVVLKNEEIQLKAIEILLENDRIVPEEQLGKAINCLNICTRLFDFMHEKDKLEYFPMKLLNQEYLAKINFIKWLEEDQNLGKAPFQLEFVDELEDTNNVYYAYKFKENDDENWKIGVSGGYGKYEIPTLETNNLTGSLFEKFIGFDYVEQVRNILRKNKEENTNMYNKVS